MEKLFHNKVKRIENQKLKIIELESGKRCRKSLRHKEKKECKKRQKNAIKLLHFFIC